MKYFSVLVIVLSLVILAKGLPKDIAYEGECNTPAGIFDKTLDLEWITTIPKLYISFGSLQYWVQNAQACLGTEPLTLGVLANMDLRTKWDLNTTMICYGRSISQDCSLNQNDGNPFVSCKVTHSDAGMNPRIFDGFSKRVVLTDNKTFALFMRCTNGLRSYYIGSPNPTISHSAIVQSIFKIISLGFQPTLFMKNPAKDIECAAASVPAIY